MIAHHVITRDQSGLSISDESGQLQIAKLQVSNVIQNGRGL